MRFVTLVVLVNLVGCNELKKNSSQAAQSGTGNVSQTAANNSQAELQITAVWNAVVPNACTGITVYVSNAVTALTAAESIGLSSSSSTGHFYSDSACKNVTTSTSVGPGTNPINYYADTALAGSTTLTATDNGSLQLSPATTTLMVEQPTQMTISSVGNQATGACISRDVQAYGADGNAVELTQNVTVTLSVSGGGLYSDANCTQAVTTATISNSSYPDDFFFTSKTAGNFTITATAPTSLALPAATSSVTVSPTGSAILGP